MVKAAEAPTLVKDGVNGKSFVRFGGEGSLVVDQDHSPTEDVKDFTVAVVFRTTQDGANATETIRGEATLGVVGARETISTTASKQASDWCVAWKQNGVVACGLGGKSDAGENQTVTISGFKPCKLNDGVPHVVVYSADVSNGNVRQMVDGMVRSASTDNANVRTMSNGMAIGAAGDGTVKGYFTGDIAAVRIYKKALTTDEMTQLTKYYCDQYGLMPLAREEFAAADAKGGLGATNISVAAGATLALPTDAAFKLASGRTLANAGMVSGALELAEGATLACVCGADPLPSYGAVTVKGTVTVSVSGVPTEGGSLRQPLFAYESIDLTDGQLVPVGTDVDPTVHTIVCKNGKAYLRRNSGVLLILR